MGRNAMEKLQADSLALHADLKAFHISTYITDAGDLDPSAEVLWLETREVIARSYGARLTENNRIQWLHTQLGQTLRKMLLSTSRGTFHDGAGLAGCMRAEPLFIEALQPKPASDNQPDEPLILLEGDKGVEAVLKLTGEPTLLGLAGSELTPAGLYGFLDGVSSVVKMAKAMDGPVVMPMQQLVRSIGTPHPLRLTNFALDAAYRKNIGSLLNQNILGIPELTVAAEQRATADHAMALRRGQQVLNSL